MYYWTNPELHKPNFLKWGMQYAFLLSFLGDCENTSLWKRLAEILGKVSVFGEIQTRDVKVGTVFFKALKTELRLLDFCFWPRWSNKDQIYLPTWGNEKTDQNISMQQQFSRHWVSRNESQWSAKARKTWDEPCFCAELPSSGAKRRKPQSQEYGKLWAEQVELSMQGASMQARVLEGRERDGATPQGNKGVFWTSTCQQIQQLD